MDNITNFIKSAVDDKPFDAYSHFETEMYARVEKQLADREREYVSTLFNNKSDEE